MAKAYIGGSSVMTPTRKKTSIGGNDSMIKTSSMSKSKRKSYKRYRGQGR
jgi:hypothetical protein